MNSKRQCRHVSLARSPISLYGTPCTRPQILQPLVTACAAARSPRSKLWHNPSRRSRRPQLPPPPFLWSVHSPATARGSRICSRQSPCYSSRCVSLVSRATLPRQVLFLPTHPCFCRRGWAPPPLGVCCSLT